MGDFFDEEELKMKINSFLWTHLHESVTLKEAEEIAIDLHEKIMRKHEEVDNKN